MNKIYITSNTSGGDGTPGCVGVSLNAKDAKRLLAYRALVRAAAKFDDKFYCIEFFNYEATFGSAAFEVGDEWVRLPLAGGIDAEDVTANTIKFTTTGVLWSASLKHANVTVESEELSYKTLEAVARGENPFKGAEFE